MRLAIFAFPNPALSPIDRPLILINAKVIPSHMNPTVKDT